MINLFKNVLVLAPHTDDGELGAGGTISKLIENGAKVTYIAFSTAEQSVPSHLPRNILTTEVKLATSILGIASKNLHILNYEVRRLNYFRQDILENLIDIRKNSEFDLVLTPSSFDIHQDHISVTQEALRAFKNITILGYELVWNNFHSSSTCISVLEKKHLDKKIDSLQQYSSQGFRNYLSPEFITSLARVRGTQIGVDYAEAFEVIRLIIG
jgi:LmbE family N-acetylglucosaminyl deacetylase